MHNRSFAFYNNLTGWIVFTLALLVYLFTVEPTTSLWDCGEFIATSYKLEVGHPPGASLFMLIARVFAMLAPSTTKVALLVNSLSALCSAFTILFLFWTISYFANKIIPAHSKKQQIIILCAGLVGSLSYAFTDSFWFSAVESEVYAMSSMFTALVFWLILKWESQSNEPYANRWLVLLAYLMGLSIGVHLLNLLALPALVFIYWYKKNGFNLYSSLISLSVSFILLAFLVWGVIPYLPVLAAQIELFVVNDLNGPVNLGLVLFVFLLFLLLSIALFLSHYKQKPTVNLFFLGLSMFVLGYCSIATIVIRSAANTPINENNPSSIFSLISYINREQYGDRPLFYGSNFDTPRVNTTNEQDQYEFATHYYLEDGRYQSKSVIKALKYEPSEYVFFPRMYSKQASHKDQYIAWANIKDEKSTTRYNIQFMLNYQFNWMYFRYFMWNFAGKQNDWYGYGGKFSGNFETGIPAFDQHILGLPDASILPPYLKNNKGRNHYYLIPLLLGLLGCCFQSKHSKNNFIVVLALFVFTGLAIAFYLNMPPGQPRERDYVFVGSFYAFAIWIGMGVPALYLWLSNYSKNKQLPVIFGALLGISSPLILLSQNWDDHNRANRFTAKAIGHNYLTTCDSQGILFTEGDNDTFPLWYMQEVEGFKTDVRVVNLSLLNSDWYIHQMKCQAYTSKPLNFSLPQKAYQAYTNDYIEVKAKQKDTMDIKQLMHFIQDPKNYQDGYPFIPCRTIRITVDKAAALAHGIVAKADSSRIVDYIYLSINRSGLLKSNLMLLDLLSEYKWDRPIYMNPNSQEIYLNQDPYLQLEGFTAKFVPLLSTSTDPDFKAGINTAQLYSNLMERYYWGNMEKEGVLIDYHNFVNLEQQINVRQHFIRLAQQLLLLNKTKEAEAVLDRLQELMPQHNFNYNTSTPQTDLLVIATIKLYCQLNCTDKAQFLLSNFMLETKACLAFYSKYSTENQLKYNLYYLQLLGEICQKYQLDNSLSEIANLFDFYYVE